MSYVIAAPEYLAAAASDLANIASSIGVANTVAMTPTSGVLAAGADEVSAMIAALFSTHAQAYQALSQQAASFHAQFVQLMNGGASEYALTEAANASPLQTGGQGLLNAVSTPTQAALGTGAGSQPGGISIGNGGAGANAPLMAAQAAATAGPVGFSAPAGPAVPAATVALAPASPGVMAMLPGYSGTPAPAALAGSTAGSAGVAGLAGNAAAPAETAATAAPAALAPVGPAARAGSAVPAGSATAPQQPADKAGPTASAPATDSSQALAAPAR